jgi:hypothetical protein
MSQITKTMISTTTIIPDHIPALKIPPTTWQEENVTISISNAVRAGKLNFFILRFSSAVSKALPIKFVFGCATGACAIMRLYLRLSSLMLSGNGFYKMSKEF